MTIEVLFYAVTAAAERGPNNANWHGPHDTYDEAEKDARGLLEGSIHIRSAWVEKRLVSREG
jgi:hypothetical protein